MPNVVALLAAAVFAVQGLSIDAPPTSSPAPVGDLVVYRFRNDRFVVSSIDLEYDERGHGKLVFERKGLGKPVERDIVVSEAVVRDVDAVLGRLNFLTSTETYQTQADHSNLGQVTIEVTRGAARRETEFNYTTNRDMASVQEILRGLANREMYAFDIETAIKFQPLDTPKLLDTLRGEVERGAVTDPAALLPLLRSVAEDVSLPLIARNRAGALVETIRSGKKH